MTEVQRFYREGMAAAGYGPMTFALERDEQNRLKILTVKGRETTEHYGRESWDAVRNEVKEAWRQQGVDMDQETVVIFQVLLCWKDGKATEVGPYVGAGNDRMGTAWVYDDERLDPRQLGSKASGGYYMQPCSLGEFNSHYIGGVAHELGHGFGLPHVAGPKSAPRHALMGDGNHTYGSELRGEGSGTYLHPVSAMKLARHLRFAGPLPGQGHAPQCHLTDFSAQYQEGKLVLCGRVEAVPPAEGVAISNDPADVADDYDAVGWTGPVDASGRFRVEIGDLHPGVTELRVEPCHKTGGISTFTFHYTADAQGRPDIADLQTTAWLALAEKAVECKDKAVMDQASRKIEESGNSEAKNRMNNIRARLE